MEEKLNGVPYLVTKVSKKSGLEYTVVIIKFASGYNAQFFLTEEQLNLMKLNIVKED